MRLSWLSRYAHAMSCFPYLCEGQLGFVAEGNLILTTGIRVIFVIIKPPDQWCRSLRRQLIPWCVVGELMHLCDWS